jgi:hypothetical protein
VRKKLGMLALNVRQKRNGWKVEVRKKLGMLALNVRQKMELLKTLLLRQVIEMVKSVTGEAE